MLGENLWVVWVQRFQISSLHFPGCYSVFYGLWDGKSSKMCDSGSGAGSKVDASPLDCPSHSLSCCGLQSPPWSYLPHYTRLQEQSQIPYFHGPPNWHGTCQFSVHPGSQAPGDMPLIVFLGLGAPSGLKVELDHHRPLHTFPFRSRRSSPPAPLNLTFQIIPLAFQPSGMWTCEPFVFRSVT